MGDFSSFFRFKFFVKKLIEIKFVILQTISRFFLSCSIQGVKRFVKSDFILSNQLFYEILGCTFNVASYLAIFFQTLFNKWFNYETYFYSLFIFMYYNRPTSKKTLDEIRHLRTETLPLSQTQNVRTNNQLDN